MSDEMSFDSFEQALAAGVAAFNEQRYEDAYLAWESRWLDEAGDGADLLQGLLMLAVAFSKLGDGNLRAAVKLFDKGTQQVSPYAPSSFELDLDALLGSVHAWRRLATSAEAGVEVDETPAPPRIRKPTA